MLVKSTPGVNFINIFRTNVVSAAFFTYIRMYVKKASEKTTYVQKIRTYNVGEIDPWLGGSHCFRETVKLVLICHLVESRVFLRHASHADGSTNARQLRLIGREEGAVVEGCASTAAGVVLPVATYYRFVLPHLSLLILFIGFLSSNRQFSIYRKILKIHIFLIIWQQLALLAPSQPPQIRHQTLLYKNMF